jgi:hypothetical protein
MNEIVSSGKYYLGDPSLVLPDSVYHGIFGDLYNYANGKFNIFGYDFAIHNTHKGDGIFMDTRKREYQVECGALALINENLIENKELCKNKGHFFDFYKKVNFIYDSGFIHITCGKRYISIDTRNSEEYESDLEEHLENAEGEKIGKTLFTESDTDSIFDNNEEYFESRPEVDSDDEEKENIPTERMNFFTRRY